MQGCTQRVSENLFLPIHAPLSKSYIWQKAIFRHALGAQPASIMDPGCEIGRPFRLSEWLLCCWERL